MLATLFAVLAATSPADAHAYLDRSNPGDGSTLRTAPRTLRLEFSEHVVLNATHIEIVDGAGRRIPATGLRLVTDDPGDTEQPAVVIARLPRHLPPNTYRVSWETLSSDDLHRTAGLLVFGIDRSVTANGPSESLPRPGEAGLRSLVLLGIALGLGGALAGALLRRSADSGVFARAGRRAASVSVAGSAGAAVVAVVLLGYQLAPGGLGLRDLLHSAYGARWVVRESGLLALGLAGVAARRSWWRRARLLLVGGGAAACLGTALLGHAGAGSTLRPARVLATTVHLAAATTWAGAILVLALVVAVRGWRGDASGSQVRGLLRAFGLPAAACVSLMVVTGVFLASDVIGSADAALRTFYGRTFLLKLTLAGLAGLFALANHRHVRGRSDLDVPRRTVGAEALLALCVVAVTAVLTSAQPAVEPQLVRSTVVADAGPVDGQVKDLQEAVSLRPNRPGRNVAVVDVFDTRRPAPAPIAAVEVSVGGATPVAATPLSDGHWSAPVVDLVAGRTTVETIVHRPGVGAVRAVRPWTVAQAPSSTLPAVISTDPIATPLRRLAALLGAVGLLVWTVALRLRRRRRATLVSAWGPTPDADRPDPRPAQEDSLVNSPDDGHGGSGALRATEVD
ncbi:MAG: copper resistance protein CopC [Nocardioidaceae bacterium]